MMGLYSDTDISVYLDDSGMFDKSNESACFRLIKKRCSCSIMVFHGIMMWTERMKRG